MISVLLLSVLASGPPSLEEAHLAPWTDEYVREEWIAPDVRMVMRAPRKLQPDAPTRLVIFATPNGNTIEQTLGCCKAPGLDWHFDIQHVAAQIRRYRELRPKENVIVACIEAEGLAWPAWRKKHGDAPSLSRKIVDTIRAITPGATSLVTLTGHSGGGSFTWAFLDGGDTIPDWLDRIGFLDSNYSYSDDLKHGDKVLAWLDGSDTRRLVIIAYDDRNITLDGKLVVGPTGGTFRATGRMLDRFRKDLTLTESREGEFVVHRGLGGRVAAFVHPNPANKILHTVLVGEMNGMLQVLLVDAPGEWSKFGGPRDYSQHIDPTPGIPPRPADAPGGSEFIRSIGLLKPDHREEAIAREILRGNVPGHMRKFQPVEFQRSDAAGKPHKVRIEVLPDYLSIGSDADWVRMPMTPQTGQRIADAWGCALPTRSVVEEVWKAAGDKRAPIPLSANREAPATFLEHHRRIEQQPHDAGAGAITAGIKKDVVVTNRLSEKPNRVAIFGWHQADGKPIQPLTIVHVNWYVDYSHGIRLMKREVLVDGKPRDARHVMQLPSLHSLLSDEGPIARPSY
ncbi:MAG: hypothetical protein K1X57_04155 [Gemmataceae bacterium]|nr:hypothetical protein [Gemmataceae bacterium]